MVVLPRELGDDALAIAALFDEADDTPQLTLGALEPVDHRSHVVGREFHTDAFPLELR